MAIKTPICDFGTKAPDFELKSTDNKILSLNDINILLTYSKVKIIQKQKLFFFELLSSLAKIRVLL